MEDINKPQYHQEETKCLFVSRIPPSTEKMELAGYFSQFGEIFDIYISQYKTNFTPRVARVTMRDRSSYHHILSINNHWIKKGNRIKVEPLLTGQRLEEKIVEENSRKVTVFGIYGYPKRKVFEKAFKKFGKVDFCYFSHYKDRPYKALGFVVFFDKISVAKALKAGFAKIDKKKVKILPFREKEEVFEKIKNKGKKPGNYSSQNLFEKKEFSSKLEQGRHDLMHREEDIDSDFISKKKINSFFFEKQNSERGIFPIMAKEPGRYQGNEIYPSNEWQVVNQRDENKFNNTAFDGVGGSQSRRRERVRDVYYESFWEKKEKFEFRKKQAKRPGGNHRFYKTKIHGVLAISERMRHSFKNLRVNKIGCL